MGDTEETLGPWLWPGTVPDAVPIRGLNRQIKKKKTESISSCAFQIKANVLESINKLQLSWNVLGTWGTTISQKHQRLLLLPDYFSMWVLSGDLLLLGLFRVAFFSLSLPSQAKTPDSGRHAGGPLFQQGKGCGTEVEGEREGEKDILCLGCRRVLQGK